MELIGLRAPFLILVCGKVCLGVINSTYFCAVTRSSTNVLMASSNNITSERTIPNICELELMTFYAINSDSATVLNSNLT